MSRASAMRIAFAVLAVAFFATPIAARVLGVTAEQFENRRLTDPPKLSQGWNAFQQTSRYLVDHMPLRAQAVRANTQIWNDLFGADPRYGRGSSMASDRALPFASTAEHEDASSIAALAAASRGADSARSGRAGWLYLDEEFKGACDTAPNRDILRRWGKVVRAIRASGRPAVVLVPPAKASVYPEYLPDEYPFDHCALDGKERLWRLLASEGPELGVLELRSELMRLKAYAGDGLFQRTDSHWSTLGAFTLVRAALDAVGDGVRLDPDEIVDRGSAAYEGDLTVLSGQRRSDKRHEYGIERAPGAPRVPGRTLLIGDSFAVKWLRILEPYFEHLQPIALLAQDEFETARQIERSDTVIIESMEHLWRSSYMQDALDELRWSL